MPATRRTAVGYDTARRARSRGVARGGAVIAETARGYRARETRQPPAHHSPPDAAAVEPLVASLHNTFCEWKGQARHHTVVVNGREAIDAAWSYPTPTLPFADIR